MRLAVIDCGTNTFNLIITEVDATGNYTKLFRTRASVKLGEGAINEGYIAREPFRRGLDAIQAFEGFISEHKVDQVLAFATSAIRDASNGGEFVKMVRDQFDIEVQVIDGDREAELIYFGTREAVALNDKIALIMDIGGGSTEFILASKEQILWKQSFRLGAARLLEKISPSDPITEEEVNDLDLYLQEQLQPLFTAIKKHKPTELIGSSGAFDSLVEMIHGELGGERLLNSKTEYEVDLENYFKISELVRRSTLKQRRQIRGLVSMRFDMIVISCQMIDFILKNLNLKRLRVSIYSLKEGVVADFISKRTLNSNKDHGKNISN